MNPLDPPSLLRQGLCFSFKPSLLTQKNSTCNCNYSFFSFFKKKRGEMKQQIIFLNLQSLNTELFFV